MSQTKLLRIGRVLGLLCAAVVAVPVVYAVVSLAVGYGLYALWGVVGLALAAVEVARSPSLGSLRTLAGIGFWLSLALLLCAGTLCGAWIVVRRLGAMIVRRAGPGNRTPSPRASARGAMRWGVPLLVPLLLGGAWLALPPARDERPKTHLTLYLDPAVIAGGGALVVAGIPVPDAPWRALPLGDDLAMLDPANPKAAEVGPEDRHFGAVITSAVAIVEFRYPEAGPTPSTSAPCPAPTTPSGDRCVRSG